jgi:hypothetical protein
MDERRWASGVSLNQTVEIQKNEQSYGLTPLSGKVLRFKNCSSCEFIRFVPFLAAASFAAPFFAPKFAPEFHYAPRPRL